jgi:DNA adenine methylase
MTNYHGGKQKIGKELSKIIYEVSTDIENNYEFDIKGYCEPFCGMLGVYQHIPELFKDHNPKLTYKAGDGNKSVIMMWKAAQKGWKPPTSCSEEHYNELKYNKKDSAEKGFIGHQYSFGGQYFMGYRGIYGNKTRYEKASENVIRISKEIKNVDFRYGDYTQFSDLKGYIIYCDPPYSNSKQIYSSQYKFDTEKFWEWCDTMSENNILFVSEYKIPKKLKAELVFSKIVKLSGNTIKNRKRNEKLFVIY